MVQYKTEAIVLRLQKYREADALITLLTQEKGKVTGVARGIYKPSSKLRAGVQPYSINEMMLDAGRSGLHTLLQSECVEMLLPLRHRYERMAFGAYWAELLENFGQEGMADEDLYRLAKAGFLGLAIHGGALLGRVLEIRLIEQQGLQPDFDGCCVCGEAIEKGKACYFSSGEGGFLCEACAKGNRAATRVNPAIPGLWQGLGNLAMDKLGRLKVNESQLHDLGLVVRQWIALHTGKAMKSWPMINDL